MLNSLNKIIINSLLLIIIGVVAFVYFDLSQESTVTAFEESTKSNTAVISQQVLNAATVESIQGEVSITPASGNTNKLSAGDQVAVGDVIKTAASATAELQFSDQSKVTLYENTQLKIIDYEFADKQAGKNIAQLLRGQLRVFSGLIGKRENDVYELRTHVSTIGIRGTEYLARFCFKQECFIENKAIKAGLYLGVIDGEVVSNSIAGETAIKPGELYYQLRNDQVAEKINVVPGLFVEGERIAKANPDGRQWILETTE